MKKISHFLLLFFAVLPVLAQEPEPKKSQEKVLKPLFETPTKLDPSGRPLYDTWQKQDHERKIRLRQHQKTQSEPGAGLTEGNKTEKSLYNTNAATSETSKTPSSAITNRPIQVQDVSDESDEKKNESGQ